MAIVLVVDLRCVKQNGNSVGLGMISKSVGCE